MNILHNLKSLLLATTAFLPLAGCQLMEDDGQKQVRYFLLDSGSAQFRNLRKVADGSTFAYCGEVNAKNRYGAYTGFERFVTIDRAVFLGSDAQIYPSNSSSATGDSIPNAIIVALTYKLEADDLAAQLKQQRAGVRSPVSDKAKLVDLAWKEYCNK